MQGDETAKPRVLNDFEGSWRLRRHISSRNGPDADFQGTAIWTPDKGALSYKEVGEMVMQGHPPMQAERRYTWMADLSVFFEDGRFFHRVPAKGGATEHWCDPDMYHLRYEFTDWSSFRVFWRVTGPRKDYDASTLYTRL